MSLAGEIRARLADGIDTVKVAPGRVNLIGEHTDYSSLPVLPMAIDRSVRVEAKRSARPGLRVDSERLGNPVEFPTDQHLSSHVTSATGWHRYVLAACTVTGPIEGGVDMLIDGDLPSQGGLSSSSALTVAIIAALSELQEGSLSADALVDKAVEAERLTGVAGGAMDQNVIVRAEPGHAMRIGFDPLNISQVPIPGGLEVVVAYSGSNAEKGAAAKTLYNSRVLGCTIAAAQLSFMLGASMSSEPRLADVAKVDGVIGAISALPDRMSIEDIEDRRARDLLTGSGWDPSHVVPVKSCANHVLAETARVDQAFLSIRENDRSRLGNLFDASHRSLQQFGASTAGLDRLVVAMRAAGAYGARLTGAGFGGYAVAVCGRDEVEAVVAAGADTGGGPAFRVRASKGLA